MTAVATPEFDPQRAFREALQAAEEARELCDAARRRGQPVAPLDPLLTAAADQLRAALRDLDGSL